MFFLMYAHAQEIAAAKKEEWKLVPNYFIMNGTIIYHTEDYSQPKFDPFLARRRDLPNSMKIREIADKYLREVYGNDFQPEIGAISLSRRTRLNFSEPNWYWSITYFSEVKRPGYKDPQVFVVYLNIDGEVLMKKHILQRGK
jgi:hypothetical protein